MRQIKTLLPACFTKKLFKNINNYLISFQTHTTTLGEQEIQNAVEAAAVIFKKVVLQRRQEKKAAEEGMYTSIDLTKPLIIYI